MRLIPNIISILFFVLYPLYASALPNDSEQIMHITANSTEFNYKTGIDIYEGQVKVNQGTTELMADRVITKKNTQHKIIEVIALGIQNLAEYTTLPKQGDALFAAKSKIIKYYPISSLIILEEKVAITQGENSFHGPIIFYNMKDQVVTSPASKKGRSTIVIQPKQIKT